jgi:hypothetical protein
VDPQGLRLETVRRPARRSANYFAKNNCRYSFRGRPVALLKAGIKARSHLHFSPLGKTSARRSSPDASQFLPEERAAEIYRGTGISQQGSLQWILGGAGRPLLVRGGHSRDFSVGYPGADGAESGVRLNGKAPASPTGRSAGQTLGTQKTQQSFTILHQNELVSPPREARCIFPLDTSLPLVAVQKSDSGHKKTRVASAEGYSLDSELHERRSH